jgi:N-acetylmuramoyl-L-alanine amidase
MARVERLKRRLLREAIHHNIDLIDGSRTRRRRPPTSSRARTFTLLLIPFLVYTGIRMATVDTAEAESTLQGLAMTLIPTEQFREPESEAIDRFINQPAPDASTSELIPLAVHRIVIDPGHGGDSPGTMTGNGLLEKEVVLDIGLRLRDLLVDQGFEVAMTRDTDRTVTLEERVEFANQEQGDLFLSIHINWIETRNVRGVETYYLGPTEDPYIKRLTQNENSANSGYSMSDFRRLLQGVYEQVRQDESRTVAENVQTAMFRSLRKVNPKLKNRGIKTAPFVVLIGTEMPAILAEVSCLSNDEEARLLQKPRYRQYIAEALAKGVQAYADEKPQPSPPTSQTAMRLSVN